MTDNDVRGIDLVKVLQSMAVVVRHVSSRRARYVLARLLALAEAEIAEPWDEENLWTARRVRAVILDEPAPPHPSTLREP